MGTLPFILQAKTGIASGSGHCHLLPNLFENLSFYNPILKALLIN
jgi:hypothetical protein